MGISIEDGAKLPLRVLLEDRAEDKFPRAILRDQLGAQIGLAIALAHIANGFYGDDSVTKPDIPNLTVEYDIFDDAEFTTPTANLNPTGERFDKVVTGSLTEAEIRRSVSIAKGPILVKVVSNSITVVVT